MFFNKLNAILYLRRGRLELWEGTKHISDFVFTQDIVDNLEIVNQKKFENLLLQFILSCGLKAQDIIFILADDIIFNKAITNQPTNKNSIEQFFSRIPFDPQNVARCVLYKEGQIHLFAANLNMLASIKHMFKQAGWKVRGAVPLQVFTGIDTRTPLNSESVDKIIKQAESTKEKDFFAI